MYFKTWTQFMETKYMSLQLKMLIYNYLCLNFGYIFVMLYFKNSGIYFYDFSSKYNCPNSMSFEAENFCF